MSRRAPLRLAAALSAAWSCAMACAPQDGTLVAACPDRASFVEVSPVLEATCGTLDCHGAGARPLRIYGVLGMRLAPTDLPGGAPTTAAELEASRRSLCSVEPEAVSAVVSGAAEPDELLVVGKARGTVHHEGGALLRAGDDGDECLTSWLAGSVDAAACTRALGAPIP